MPLLRYLGRAAAWSLGLFLAWRLAAPLVRPVLEGLTELFLALFHAPQPLTQKPHLGPVLFLALFLAAQPRGKRSLALGLLGAFACLAAQALTTAVLLVASDERRPEMRLCRDLAIAIDKVMPLAAALVLVPRARRASAPPGRRISQRMSPRPPGPPSPPFPAP